MNRVKNTYFEKLLQLAASELLIEWFSEVLFGVFSAPYTVRMRENTDQKNSEYGHFSRSVNGGGILLYITEDIPTKSIKGLQSVTRLAFSS